MIFDGAFDFSSPTSPSAAHHRRVGRHLTQNWSDMLRNDDSENRVLGIQGMSWSYRGHARRSLEVVRSTLLLGTKVKIRAPLQYTGPVTL